MKFENISEPTPNDENRFEELSIGNNMVMFALKDRIELENDETQVRGGITFYNPYQGSIMYGHEGAILGLVDFVTGDSDVPEVMFGEFLDSELEDKNEYFFFRKKLMSLFVELINIYKSAALDDQDSTITTRTGMINII